MTLDLEVDVYEPGSRRESEDLPALVIPIKLQLSGRSEFCGTSKAASIAEHPAQWAGWRTWRSRFCLLFRRDYDDKRYVVQARAVTDETTFD